MKVELCFCSSAEVLHVWKAALHYKPSVCRQLLEAVVILRLV